MANGSESPRRMRLVSFKEVRNNTLLGFATVELPNGLTVADCPVCTGYGKTWASLPSKSLLDREARHIEEGAKKKYLLILQWPDRATNDRWSDAVVALVREAHPEAFAP